LSWSFSSGIIQGFTWRDWINPLTTPVRIADPSGPQNKLGMPPTNYGEWYIQYGSWTETQTKSHQVSSSSQLQV